MAIIGGNFAPHGVNGMFSARPMGNTFQAAPHVGFLPQVSQQSNVGFLPHMQQPMQLSGAPQQAAPSPWMQQAPWGQAPQWPQAQPWPQPQPFAGNRLAGLGTASAFGQPMNRLAGLPGNGGIY